MTEAQALNLENVDEGKPITFTPLEWKYFVLELKDMIAAKEFDIPKVINAARFYAQIERSTQQYKQGKCVTFTEKEWEDFVKAQELYLDGR